MRKNEIMADIFYKKEVKNVFHYTSINALFNIINDKELRLTNAMYLNDREEFVNFIDVLKNRFNTGFKFDQFVLFLDEIKENQLNGIEESHNLAYYIFSTCKSLGDLPMWNWYSKGEGICIEFDNTELADFFKKSINNLEKADCYQYDCIYTDEDKKEILTESIKEAKTIITKPKRDKFDLWNLLCPFSFSFKNKQFFYENEHRYVVKIDVDEVIDNNSEIIKVKYDFYCSNNSIKPSINISFDKIPIKRIIVSPRNSNETIINGIKLFLQNKGYKDIEVIKFDSAFREC